jgi:protein CpxP
MNPARYKTLVAIIAVLLLSNIAMIVYFVGWRDGGRGGHGHKSPMTDFLQKEVGFSTQQMATFDSLRQQHRTSVKPLFDDLSQSRDSLYQLIGGASPADSVQQAASAIGRKQANLELKMFENFRQIRAICTPGQLSKFDSLAPSLVHRMMGQSKKQGPPPR